MKQPGQYEENYSEEEECIRLQPIFGRMLRERIDILFDITVGLTKYSLLGWRCFKSVNLLGCWLGHSELLLL